MGLSPFTTSLDAVAAHADSTTETYDVPSRGRRGVLLVVDVTAIGNGSSYVTSADISLPVTIDASHNQFAFNSVQYIIANGVYTTLATLAAAVQAATTSFSVQVTVTVDPNGTGLRFTRALTGVHAEAFAAGSSNDCLARIGITAAWTIARTQAAGADGAYSQTVTIQGKDEASGKFYDLLSGAAMSTVLTQILQVHPSMPAATNAIATAQLPANLRIKVTHTSNNQISRTFGLQLIS